jgi:Flavodoxin reductases (ferredoxin-NADPH reductases) family 1
MTARLLESREIAQGVRHFEFELTGGEEFSFAPGQFVSFKRTFEGKEIVRAYSIASVPNGSRFALCLNEVPSGLFSPFLFSLQPGAEIEVAPPLGYFTLRNRDRDILMIATGTGVAPFRSILTANLAELSTQVTLLLGTRYASTLLYREEFEDLARKYPNFRFWPTITRPDEDWTGRTGRVQQHLDEALGGRTDLDVYLCGLKEMVDDIRGRLKQRGFDRKHLVYEKYD